MGIGNVQFMTDYIKAMGATASEKEIKEALVKKELCLSRSDLVKLGVSKERAKAETWRDGFVGGLVLTPEDALQWAKAEGKLKRGYDPQKIAVNVMADYVKTRLHASASDAKIKKLIQDKKMSLSSRDLLNLGVPKADLRLVEWQQKWTKTGRLEPQSTRRWEANPNSPLLPGIKAPPSAKNAPHTMSKDQIRQIRS
jgi:hypothetical protein